MQHIQKHVGWNTNGRKTVEQSSAARHFFERGLSLAFDGNFLGICNVGNEACDNREFDASDLKSDGLSH